MKKTLFAMICLSFLTGCATYPVYGKVKGSDEKFVGSATSYMGGSGSVNMMASNNAKCEGTYDFDQNLMGTTVTGHGKFTCDDGRSGNFSYAGGATSGQGFGKMSDGKKLDFYFGQVALIKGE